MTGTESIDKLVMANAIAIAFVLVKELWSIFKDSTKENTKAITELNQTCNRLDQSIVKLNVQMEYVHRDLDVIPKLKADLDSAHAKLRDLERVVHRKGGDS